MEIARGEALPTRQGQNKPAPPYFRNGKDSARQANQIGSTIVAPAKAGFQKFRAAQLASPPTEARKLCIAPMTFTSGDAGSNSLAITKKPTRMQSRASLIQPHQLMPTRRRRIWRFSFGNLPVLAAVSPIFSSAGSVTAYATSLTISTWCGYGIEMPC